MCSSRKGHLLKMPLMVVFCLATMLTITGCQSSDTDTESDTSSSVATSSSVSSAMQQSSVSSVASSAESSQSMESCSAQSCGEDGSELTCLRANGCICSQEEGCIDCKTKNDVCKVSADCCGGLGLECQSVTLTNGSTEKRCMTVLENICTVSCSAEGAWNSPSRCKNGNAPEDTPDCDEVVGECVPPIDGERNETLCIKS